MVRRRSTVRFRKGALKSTPGLWPVLGGVAQVVEQTAHNRCVGGSSPPTATDDPDVCEGGPGRFACAGRGPGRWGGFRLWLCGWDGPAGRGPRLAGSVDGGPELCALGAGRRSWAGSVFSPAGHLRPNEPSCTAEISGLGEAVETALTHARSGRLRGMRVQGAGSLRWAAWRAAKGRGDERCRWPERCSRACPGVGLRRLGAMAGLTVRRARPREGCEQCGPRAAEWWRHAGAAGPCRHTAAGTPALDSRTRSGARGRGQVAAKSAGQDVRPAPTAPPPPTPLAAAREPLVEWRAGRLPGGLTCCVYAPP